MRTINGWNNLEYSKISNVKIGGKIAAPYFRDAYIIDADYNGFPMSEKQIDTINKDRLFIVQTIKKQYYGINERI